MQKMGALVILVDLLYLSGISFGQECIRELLDDVNFPGTDLTFVYSPDMEHCQMLCTQHPSCLFFTFIREDWTRDGRHFYCYLKSTASGKHNKQVPLQGVTSGYSLKPCSPDPSPCLSYVYQDVNFPGADYRSLFTADYTECQRACTHDPNCQFFTFINGHFKAAIIRHKCHLKFSWTVPRTPKLRATIGAVSGFSHNLYRPTPFCSVCQTKFFPDTNIPGSDLEMLLAVSPEHCLSLCSAHPHCTYFSYVSKMFHCYLKNNPNRMVTVAMKGIISGIPTHFCQPDNSWVMVAHEGVDFSHSDMRFVMSADAEDCQNICTEDPNCQFYVYDDETFSNSDYWGRCYLKRVITLPAPPKVAKLKNVVSGFSLKNC